MDNFNGKKIEVNQNYNLILTDIKTWSDELDKSIHMPRLQRDFVWKPKQIATLWDSLLRGMPFGSLIVLAINSNTKVKDEQAKKLKEVTTGWQLLDGQQRSRSIKGGFEFTEGKSQFKLWIGCTRSNNPDLNFDIKVTTRAHPFGYNKDFNKLDLNTRRRAYERHGKGNKLSLETAKLYSNDINKIYIPLHEILAVLAIKQTETEIIHYLCTIFNISDIKNTIILELATGLLKLKQAQIIAQPIDSKLLINNEQKIQKDEHLDIEVLFKRVGTAGSSLSNIDFAYSVIKQEIPDAYEFVERAFDNTQLERIFSPLNLIAIALRSCCAKADENKLKNAITKDCISYSKVDIGKILSNDENKKLIVELLKPGQLTTALIEVFDSLLYNEKTNPNGLPLYLLKNLNIAVWQILVHWRLLNKIKRNEISHIELIKFVMYYLLFKPIAKVTSKLSVSLMKVIKRNCNNQFPSQDLIIEFINCYDGKYFSKLPNEEKFTEKIITTEKVFKINSKVNGNLLRCGLDHENVYHNFWWRRELLLWLQRKYLNSLMLNENSKIASEITPYDYDHIVPQNSWSYLGSAKGISFKKFLPQTDDWKPNRQLGNSIGNYQLLGFSDNREKQDVDYSSFYINLDNNENILDTKSYIESELLISTSAHEYFKKTLNKNDKWNENSVMNFQSAIEQRTCDLYGQFVALFENDPVYIIQS